MSSSKQALKKTTEEAMPIIISAFNISRITAKCMSIAQLLQALRFAWKVASQSDGGGQFSGSLAYSYHYAEMKSRLSVGQDAYSEMPTLQGRPLLELWREVLAEEMEKCPPKPIQVRPFEIRGLQKLPKGLPAHNTKVDFTTLDLLGCVFWTTEALPLTTDLKVIHENEGEHFAYQTFRILERHKEDYEKSFAIQCFEPQIVLRSCDRDLSREINFLNNRHFAFAHASYCAFAEPDDHQFKLTTVVNSPEKVDELLSYVESVGIPLTYYKAWLLTGYTFPLELKSYIQGWDAPLNPDLINFDEVEEDYPMPDLSQFI